MTQDNENAGATLTLLERWKHRAQQNPFIAAILLVFVVVVSFAGGWRQVTGDHLWVSIKGMLTAGPQSYEECVEEANDVFMEVMKCKNFFGERP